MDAFMIPSNLMTRRAAADRRCTTALKSDISVQPARFGAKNIVRSMVSCFTLKVVTRGLVLSHPEAGQTPCSTRSPPPRSISCGPPPVFVVVA
jgi:hypothetical protein